MKVSKKDFCILLSIWIKSGESIDRILAENICKVAKNGIIREQAVLDLLTESKRRGAILPNALWSLSMLRYI